MSIGDWPEAVGYVAAMAALASVGGEVARGEEILDRSDILDESIDAIEVDEKARPSWRQSEIDARQDFAGYREQVSFKDGVEVPYGTKGSVRPDFYKKSISVDIKNYNIENRDGRRRLVNNISKQYEQRKINLANGTRQIVQIDIRGQNVDDEIIEELYDSISAKTENNMTIYFKTR